MALQNENFILSVANEILRECAASHGAAEIDFVMYVLKLMLLNPAYGKLFNRKKLHGLVRSCASTLLETESPALITLKMQLYFDNNYDSYRSLVDKNMSIIESRLSPLVNEIINVKPTSRDEEEKLFRKMTIYFVLNSGLGNPGNLNVKKFCIEIRGELAKGKTKKTKERIEEIDQETDKKNTPTSSKRQ